MGLIERQELPVQLPCVALIDKNAARIQRALDFYQLLMFVLMLPPNIGQYIQAIGALRQAEQGRLAGIVMLPRMAAKSFSKTNVSV